MQEKQSQEIVENMNELGKVTSQILKRNHDCAQEIIHDCIEANKKRFDKLSSLKDPKQFTEVQASLFNDARDQISNTSQKMFNATQRNFEDMNKWLSNYGHLFNPMRFQSFSLNPFQSKSFTETSSSATSSKK